MVQIPKQPGFDHIYVPATVDMVKDVITGETGGTIQQADDESFVRLMGDQSLINVHNPVHKHLRALLMPAFQPEAVASYLPQIQALVKHHMDEWVAAGAEGVKAYPKLKLLTFDFIIQITLGREYSREEILALSADYSVWTSGFLSWPWLDIPFTPFANAMAAKRKMLAHFQEATNAARDKLAAGQPVPGVLGILVAAKDEQGNRLTDQQIVENILLLLLAGHDTSSTTLAHTLSNLQDHPEVLDKLRAEQEAVLATHGKQLTAAALKDMPYADAVIRETLRRTPVVEGLFRMAVEDFPLGEYAVPKDMHLLLPLKYLAETDPRWVNETGDLHPAVFHPDRMMTPEGQKPGQQMPFGHGSRYCLGANLAMAEMKVLLALMARYYSFTADNKTEWVQGVGKVPKNGLPLVLTQLDASSKACIPALAL
eukprot:GHRR01008078.1.p1 GENE.GHRR01008078.1~~GHRR01008078.1.p1  ORF type:complete len:426 (+),score=141.85 GHRR01008078.1:697-1974(+)